MNYRVLMLALLLAGPAAAQSANHGDFDAAVTAGKRGDFDEAIRRLTSALAQPGLQNDQKARLLLHRAFAYEETGAYHKAIADYNGVIALKPDSAEGFYRRGIARREAGDYQQALADFDSVLASGKRVPPDWPFIYGDRGVARFAAGRFGEAAQDFTHILAKDPQDQYAMLWLATARSRDGHFDAKELARQAKTARNDLWPHPLIAVFLGQAKAEDAMHIAAGAEEEPRQNQECEADFFLGENALKDGHSDAARTRFRRVLDDCSPGLAVHAGAAGELSRLGK